MEPPNLDYDRALNIELLQIFIERKGRFEAALSVAERIPTSSMWGTWGNSGEIDQQASLLNVQFSDLTKIQTVFDNRHVFLLERIDVCRQRFLELMQKWGKPLRMDASNLTLQRVETKERADRELMKVVHGLNQFPTLTSYCYLSPHTGERVYHMPKDSPFKILEVLNQCHFFTSASPHLEMLRGSSAPQYLGYTIKEGHSALDQMSTLIAVTKPCDQYEKELELLKKTYPDHPCKPLNHPAKPLFFGLLSKDQSRESKAKQERAMDLFYRLYAIPKLYLSHYIAVHIPTQKELVEDYQMSLEEVAYRDFIFFFHRPTDEREAQVFDQAPFHRFSRFHKRIKTTKNLEEFEKEILEEQKNLRLQQQEPNEASFAANMEKFLLLEVLKMGDQPTIGRSFIEKASLEAYMMGVEIEQQSPSARIVQKFENLIADAPPGQVQIEEIVDAMEIDEKKEEEDAMQLEKKEEQ